MTALPFHKTLKSSAVLHVCILYIFETNSNKYISIPTGGIHLYLCTYFCLHICKQNIVADIFVSK